MPGNFFQGVTPPAGNSSDNLTSTANADGTTVTASSGDSTAPGGSTHTTNGVAPPPVGHGNRIPEDTTHPEHIDLATRRVENLGKIAAKRKLDPHEQGIFENALRVRHRNTPAQPGDRNNPLPSDSRSTPNPQDLVMAGGDGPISQSQSNAADAPPPAAPAQPAHAIGSTINGPTTANPDAPRASAEGVPNSTTLSAPQPHIPQPSTQSTSGTSEPPQTSPLPPPRTPPLSVEQSRRLIENVAKMPARARQHPQVQADEAQARAVVNAQSPNKTEASASEEAPPNVREPEAHGAIPPPGNLPPKPAWVPATLVAHWNGKLDAARVRDPADHTEILEHLENLGPLNKLQVYRAVQGKRCQAFWRVLLQSISFSVS